MSYGFQNYYALLNCGFNLRPSAGNASGVHPVPLGFGRVYVKVDGRFTYEKFLAGLDAGRSFVTTGPMLMADMDGRQAGHRFRNVKPGTRFKLKGRLRTDRPIADSVDIIRNGDIITPMVAQPILNKNGSYEIVINNDIEIETSSWIAVRYLERRANDRLRFTHSGIFHFDVPGSKVRPKPQEIAFLIGRMQEQIARSEGVLPESAIAEYRKALKVYEDIAQP